MPAPLENKECIKCYRKLYQLVRPTTQTCDLKRIRKAFLVAFEAHQAHSDVLGRPYIYSLIEVAIITKQAMGLGTTVIICALLYNIWETAYPLGKVKEEFGLEVFRVLDHSRKFKLLATKENQVNNVQEMVIAYAQDKHALWIQMAECLYHMRMLDQLPYTMSVHTRVEAKYFYAPLAHRMYLHDIKAEFDDLQLKFTHPSIYNKLAKHQKTTKIERSKALTAFSRTIHEALTRHQLIFSIKKRIKSIASTWEKMQKHKIPFEEVYDLAAIRIIIDPASDTEENVCWKVYHIVTKLYQPHPSRMRDWISTPKDNGYEALHITVRDPNGQWVEVQIRTQRMDSIAEHGRANHWKYKENGQYV